MADTRIYSWTDDANPVTTASIPIDDATFTEAKSVTIDNLLNLEATPRIAADNAIIDGAGLNSDGTLSPEVTSTYLKNADFLAAGLDVNLRNMSILLDTAISAAVSGNMLTIQFDITSAEILALATAVGKISAPGAGNIFHTMEVEARNFFNTAAYVSAGAGGIDIRFVGASDVIASLDKTFLESAADVTAKFPVVRHDMPTNVAIEVHAPDGNPTTGDGTITVRLYYQIKSVLTIGAASQQTGCCVQPLADSFVDGDLTAGGNLVITHGMNTQNLFLVVLDNLNAQSPANFTLGDEAGLDTFNKITVPIGAGIAGTWKYALITF